MPSPSYSPSDHPGGRIGDYGSAVTEQTPLLSPHNSTKLTHSLPYRSVAILLLVAFVIIPLSVSYGVWIHKTYGNDTLEPAVRDRIRKEWAIEMENHERVVERARQEEEEWYKKKLKREREEAERIEREKRERVRMRLYWDEIQGDPQCLGYETRRYSAYLANLLPTIDAIEACRATPITIHGVTYRSPLYCEDRGAGIIGHWLITNEPVCSTYWEYFKDKGCITPKTGLRRIEAPLGGLRGGDNAEEMCFSTPASIRGQHFDRPTACPNWGPYGYWGIWNVPDDECR